MIALGIGAIISKLVIGPLSDKTGRLKMIYLCGFFIFLGVLGMALKNEITLFISAFVFALGYGAVWAMYAAASSDYFNKESSGTISGHLDAVHGRRVTGFPGNLRLAGGHDRNFVMVVRMGSVRRAVIGSHRYASLEQ